MNFKTFPFFLGLLLFTIDFLLKYFIHTNISLMDHYPFYPYGGMGIFKNFFGIDFAIVHATNKGAAWGLFASLHQYLIWFRWFVIGGILCYLFINKFKTFSKISQIGFIAILTGAFGNVFDHYFYGHVVDMFYFTFFGYSYPIFNVADISIFCGCCLILLSSIRKEQSKRRIES
ncbi:MAG: signal peptidase II [Chlamydiae bacterium]|nr:signal peptidase II [Chlamydiota bacterium]